MFQLSIFIHHLFAFIVKICIHGHVYVSRNGNPYFNLSSYELDNSTFCCAINQTKDAFSESTDDISFLKCCTGDSDQCKFIFTNTTKLKNLNLISLHLFHRFRFLCDQL